MSRLRRLRSLRDSPYTAATAVVVLGGALMVWLTATNLFPHHSLNHDEGVYLQQAAMLLEGKIWLQPPLEELFRPWFFVESPQGLYSKYAPVPAAMFAVGKLLGGYRLALVAIAAGILALTAGVVREVFDERAGLLAPIFLCLSPLFVIETAVFLPYAPTTLLNLGFAYAYLYADRTGSTRAAAIAGGAIGLAFFARPFTAVLFATPFIAHALWTLYDQRKQALPRQAATALVGLVGVTLALSYNWLVTGSPIVFPYEAFAPLDGLGFGQRRLLNHDIVYTPELAVTVSQKVLALFFTQWIAGGLLGAVAAVVGGLVVARRRPTPRELTLGGLVVTVAAGNAYFWGNYNILGGLDTPGDGLVATLGPYYHFDLLIPTAAFAAVGVLALFDGFRERLDRVEEFDTQQRQAIIAVILLIAAGGFTVGTVGAFEEPIERNQAVTETYEDAYAPFDSTPRNAVVMLPDPYGDWLNHPFQPLRNDPGFDGETVYAIDDRPFALIDAYPDRRYYRYTYRGVWDPPAGSPEAARLQRVHSATGDVIRLAATVGIPAGASSVTVRVATETDSTYYVVDTDKRRHTVRLTANGDRLHVAGASNRTPNGLPLTDRETVETTVFVDYRSGGGFSYRLSLPVERGEKTQVLTPRIQWCRDARACDGAGAYIPETAPDGISVETNLSTNPNAETRGDREVFSWN